MRKNKSNMQRGLAATLAAVALFAVQPVQADTIQLNSFWAGSGSASINFQGKNYHDGSTVSLVEGGGSGGFKTYNLTANPVPAAANSFQSWCVDIFHSFSFAVTTVDVLKSATSVFGATKANDLGRLYTVAGASVASTGTSAANSSAFQLAVWEIVNETANTFYNLGSGAFKASGTGDSVAQGWLNTLNTTSGASAYTVNIWSVQGQGASGLGAQDVAVFAPVPEPEIMIMLTAGLGLMGFVARRRQRQTLASAIS
jgi:hypothetical protein